MPYDNMMTQAQGRGQLTRKATADGFDFRRQTPAIIAAAAANFREREPPSHAYRIVRFFDPIGQLIRQEEEFLLRRRAV